jgi:mono/diheme cytochrome c family protein
MTLKKLLTAAIAVVSILPATIALSQASPSPGECPQPRFTGKAPAEYLERINPLMATAQNLSAGERLFLGTAEVENCSICHGRKGDGKGPLAKQYDPPPRNFACAKTVVDVPDGQLFWIIRFGSPETAMPPHSKLSDEQIWQLVHHLRRLAK